MVLIALVEAGGLLHRMNLLGSMRLALQGELRKRIVEREVTQALQGLINRGLVRCEYQEAKRIVKLTNKGQLEALFRRSKLPHIHQRWDGRWRVVIFDIPEQASLVRDRLRKLLKDYGFKALQASVYISPVGLNPDAVTYLKKSGLIRYIRMFRVDKFDTDDDLRKLFKV